MTFWWICMEMLQSAARWMHESPTLLPYFSNHFFLIMQNKHLSLLSGWSLGRSEADVSACQINIFLREEEKKYLWACKLKLSIHLSNAPLGSHKVHTAIIITIIIFVRPFFYFGQILLHSNPLSQLCVLLRSHPQFSFLRCFLPLYYSICLDGTLDTVVHLLSSAMQFMLANCQWWIRTKIYSAHRANCEQTAHTFCSTICGPKFAKGNTTATTTTTLPEWASHNTCWLGADIVSYLIIMIDWIWMWNTLFQSTVVMMMTAATATMVEMGACSDSGGGILCCP